MNVNGHRIEGVFSYKLSWWNFRPETHIISKPNKFWVQYRLIVWETAASCHL